MIFLSLRRTWKSVKRKHLDLSSCVVARSILVCSFALQEKRLKNADVLKSVAIDFITFLTFTWEKAGCLFFQNILDDADLL